MKLNLVESFGNRGIATECKQVLRDQLDIDVGCEGTLAMYAVNSVGTTVQKNYKTKNGTVSIPDYDILPGNNRIEFTRADRTLFKCGEINRNGRFIQTKTNADELILAIAFAYIKQQEQINEITKNISEMNSQNGINIM